MELKKTVKYDGKLKGLHMVDEQLVDMDGEIIDILDIFEKAYGDKPFDILFGVDIFFKMQIDIFIKIQM